MSHFHLSFKSFNLEGITYSLTSYEPLLLLLLMAKYKHTKTFGQGCLAKVDVGSNHSCLERSLMGTLYPVSKTIALASPTKAYELPTTGY